MANRKLIVEIVGDSRNLERTFGRLGKQSTRLGRQFGVLRSSLAALAAPTTIGLFAGDAIRKAASFEETMQRIVGLSGVAQGAIGGLTNEILKLAPTVGRGPQELAEGLQFITSSGIAAKDAMAVLEVSAKAAAAGLGETKTVADAVTSVMNAYGANVVSAASATDTLVATVREGKGEADEFAGVIGNVVSIASQLGVSFDEVGSALAAMTRLGTDAQTSATQLQQVFSNLVKVSPQQAKAFEAVGLSAAGLRKEIQDRGLLATLKTIQTAFAGNIPGLAKAFGDIRALRGVLALVGNQAEATRGIFDRMAESAGSLDKSFGAIGDTTAQQFRKLNAAVDVTRITIGAALAPAAEKAAKAITGWLSVSENQERVQRDVEAAVRKVSEVVKASVEAFRDMRDALRPVVESLGGLKETAKLLLAVLVAAKVTAFASAITGLGTQAGVSAGRVNALRGALLRLGAIGLITIGVEVIINRDKIEKTVNDFLRGHGLGFATAKQVKIDVDADSTDLVEMRNRAAAAVGETDLLVKALDKLIARNRQLEAGRSKGLQAAGAIEANRSNLQRQGGATGTQVGGAIDQAIKFFQQAVTDTSDKAQAAIVAARKASAKQKAQAEKARKAAEEASEKQRAAFDALVDSLQFGFDKAQATKGFKDDLAALDAIQAAVEKQIRVEGRTTELEQQLFQVRQQRLEIRKQLTDQGRQQEQARQFRALGLTAEGEARTPGIENLKKQLSQLTARLGTDVSPKIAAKLGRIGKVLTDPIHKATEESRRAIVQMFETIRSTFDQQAKGPLTKTTSLNANKILDGLGLGPEATKALRARLSSFNSAGVALAGATAGPTGFARVAPANQTTVVHTSVDLDGKTVARNTTRHQQKRSRRNPPQKRGI